MTAARGEDRDPEAVRRRIRLPLAPGLEQRQRDEHEHDLGVAVLLADRAGQPGETLRRRRRGRSWRRTGRTRSSRSRRCRSRPGRSTARRGRPRRPAGSRRRCASPTGVRTTLTTSRYSPMPSRMNVTSSSVALEMSRANSVPMIWTSRNADDPRERRRDHDDPALDEQLVAERHDQDHRHDGPDEQRQAEPGDQHDRGVAVQDEDHDERRDLRPDDRGEREQEQADQAGDRDDRLASAATAPIARQLTRASRVTMIGGQRNRGATGAAGARPRPVRVGSTARSVIAGRPTRRRPRRGDHRRGRRRPRTGLRSAGVVGVGLQRVASGDPAIDPPAGRPGSRRPAIDATLTSRKNAGRVDRRLRPRRDRGAARPTAPRPATPAAPERDQAIERARGPTAAARTRRSRGAGRPSAGGGPCAIRAGSHRSPSDAGRAAPAAAATPRRPRVMIRTFRPYSSRFDAATGSQATASGTKTSRRPRAMTAVDVMKSSVTPTRTGSNRSRRMA